MDVRILAATNVSLEEAVREGRFREDLYYRLHVVPIEVPPLRERREDIAPLAVRFLERSRERLGREVLGLTENAVQVLESAPWRGNVRELENTIEKAVVLTDSERIDGPFLQSLLAGLPAAIAAAEHATTRASTTEVTSHEPLEQETLAGFDRRWRQSEREYLISLVEATSWNLSAASRLAGVKNRNTLVSRLKKHELRRPDPRNSRTEAPPSENEGAESQNPESP